MLYAMLRDKEFAMAWSSKTMVIAGLLYFISPIDLLPDYIPILGYIDDAFVMSVVMNTQWHPKLSRQSVYGAGTKTIGKLSE